MQKKKKTFEKMSHQKHIITREILYCRHQNKLENTRNQRIITPPREKLRILKSQKLKKNSTSFEKITGK
jgi:hypothetical protein